MVLATFIILKYALIDNCILSIILDSVSLQAGLRGQYFSIYLFVISAFVIICTAVPGVLFVIVFPAAPGALFS